MRWLAFFTILSGFSPVAFADRVNPPASITDKLKTLKLDPEFAAHVGQNSRIMELVAYETGVMVRYQLRAGENCSGVYAYDLGRGDDRFVPDGRCAKLEDSELQGLTDSAANAPAQPLLDLETLGSAANFVLRQSMARPAVEAVLGAYYREDRVIVTFWGRGEIQPCRLALRQTTNINQIAIWRMLTPPSCVAE